jgi:antitoxin component of MazEF toxin-antitoxin module
MRTTLRRIGNSLGIIIPRAILDAWKLREGDSLSVSVDGIFPPAKAGPEEAQKAMAILELARELARRQK